MLSFVLVLLSQVLQCFVDRVGVTSVFTVVTSGVRVQISKTIQVVTMNLQTHEDIRKIPLQKESGKQKQTKEHETWEPKGSQRLLFVVSRSCQTKILVTFKVMFSSVSKSCGGGGGRGGEEGGPQKHWAGVCGPLPEDCLCPDQKFDIQFRMHMLLEVS